MLQKDAVLTHPGGMHIRAAAMVVQKAYEIENELKTNIFIRNEVGQEAPATALMAVHSLSLKPGEKVTIVAKGGNCHQAIDCFVEVLRSGLLPQNSSEIEQIYSILEENIITADKVFESIGFGLIITCAEGIISMCNNIAENIIGNEKHNCLGKKVDDFLPGLNMHEITLEQKLQISDREVIWVSISPINFENKTLGYAIILSRDIDKNYSAKNAENSIFNLDIKLDESFDILIGKSDKLLAALKIAMKASKTSSTVLLHGESGTGKELVARAIHESSDRKNEPFIKVNCPAIPSTLLESELFGHERGAFTGAIYQKIGKFELANGGTIFLDEIGELDNNMQAKLLRVIQDLELERVGGNDTIKVDVRIISATHRDLRQMVKDGNFREDLYYRLNVVPVTLPSLRDRKEDIPLLIEHFLDKLCAKLGKKRKVFSKRAVRLMCNYDWPGNVRELENIVERMINLTNDHIIEVWDLPQNISGYVSERDHSLINLKFDGELATFTEYEKAIIEAAMNRFGSFNAAGKALGLTHKTVASKARKYGLAE